MKRINAGNRSWSWSSLIVAMAVSWSISGCGGDGGSDVSGTSASAVAKVSLQGVAVGDREIAAGSVRLRDAQGRGATTTTATDGSFELLLEAVTYPVLIAVTNPSASASQTATLYAVLDAPTVGGKVWVSPISTAVVAALSRTDVATLFTALGQSSLASVAIESGRIDRIEAIIRLGLSDYAERSVVASYLNGAGRLATLPISLNLPGMTALFKVLADARSMSNIAGTAASAIDSVAIGCDVPALTRSTDGNLRPACLSGSNYPVSNSVAGRLVPVAATHPQSSLAWAEQLAGVSRGVHWKTYDPASSTALLRAPLRKKLKSAISDLWSGNKGISFPESYGIGDGPIDELVSNIFNIGWETLGPKLSAQEVSNISFQFQALRLMLESEQRGSLFFPVLTEAVTLAAPNRPISDVVYLGAMSAAIRIFSQKWLNDPSNRMQAVVDARILETSRLLGLILQQYSDVTLRTYITQAETTRVVTAALLIITQLNTQLNVAVAALPDQFAYLRQPTLAVAASIVDSLTSCVPIIDYARCDNVATRLSSASTAWGTAYGMAVSESTSQSRETAAAFYDRFLDALAQFIPTQYEEHFGDYYKVSTLGAEAGFQAVVINAELHDNLTYSSCCLKPQEIAATRSVFLYYADGAAIKFISYADGKVNTYETIEVPILLAEFNAPALANLGSGRLLGAREFATTSFVALTQAWAVTLACSSADAACMARLGRSRITPSTTILTGLAGYSTGFSVLSNRLGAAGGITETSLPVGIRE